MTEPGTYGPWTVTGLMSGSSMDGVDLATCRFFIREQGWQSRILAAGTFPYPPGLLERLSEATTLPMDEVFRLDLELGSFFGDLINRFTKTSGIRPGLISSHGHTIFHEPEKGITFQAGSGPVMADRTGIPVINDFRREDVAQGGQGAPLVPVGDRLLFGRYGACLNLGGISNISYDSRSGERLAFDICPVNLALNHLASLEGKEFDRGGEIARQGNIDRGLMLALDGLPFYSMEPPRSLGREWFLEQFLPVLMAGELPVRDRMATAVEHISRQISTAIRRSGAGKVLVTGGGTLNNFLVERLRTLTGTGMVIPDEKLVLYKEALVFALLGLLRWLGEVNCLASVTGGRKDLSAGVIHKPKKQIET